jgi:hypothetical protein
MLVSRTKAGLAGGVGLLFAGPPDCVGTGVVPAVCTIGADGADLADAEAVPVMWVIVTSSAFGGDVTARGASPVRGALATGSERGGTYWLRSV